MAQRPVRPLLWLALALAVLFVFAAMMGFDPIGLETVGGVAWAWMVPLVLILVVVVYVAQREEEGGLEEE